jgi:mannosyltransferase OCH1-like enzyme
MGQIIPKIIHQIWSDINDPLPDIFRVFGETWKKNHPDWRYEFWDEARMNHFVREHYPQYLETYTHFSYNIQRWDAIRYLFLYEMGGMYVDFDSECLEPLDDLLKDRTCCFSLEPEEHGKVFDKAVFFNNALIAVVPRNPFIKVIIDHVFNNPKKVQFTTLHNKGIEVQESTGPLRLVSLYENYPEKDGIYLIPAEYVSPFNKYDLISFQKGENLDELEKKLEKAYSIHYFFNTWTKGKNSTT